MADPLPPSPLLFLTFYLSLPLILYIIASATTSFPPPQTPHDFSNSHRLNHEDEPITTLHLPQILEPIDLSKTGHDNVRLDFAFSEDCSPQPGWKPKPSRKPSSLTYQDEDPPTDLQKPNQVCLYSSIMSKILIITLDLLFSFSTLLSSFKISTGGHLSPCCLINVRHQTINLDPTLDLLSSFSTLLSSFKIYTRGHLNPCCHMNVRPFYPLMVLNQQEDYLLSCESEPLDLDDELSSSKGLVSPKPNRGRSPSGAAKNAGVPQGEGVGERKLKMAGSPSDNAVVGELSNGTASVGQYEESLEGRRSSEQVDNGIPLTSSPYSDTDDDHDDCEPKPSSLYGKFTWKIENFEQINRRELRSNVFVVAGYKWYILIYPQGCDVQNHLSLFICVANHDKLIPGWSHFAQFTIAVVNKDPKNSKYSDTLHRFSKKEHDWGWKKFMKLSEVSDGFIVADALILKAQVQVIREIAQRPFRCLDSQYKRELVRVYSSNVEQICRRFVEEKKSKFGKFIEDKFTWLSFCEYWPKVDKDVRHHMSREEKDVILRVAVKHFFIEKEMTSTLVMDSLYSGLKALTRETPDRIVCVENDMFVLAGDVIPLLVRASVEPLPPKDEKGPQNRIKDGNSGEELNKDSSESDERWLKELGRRTVEIFVLSHIFSNKIEIAYQNAIALEKQEELIREEAQSKVEQKARSRVSETEKRAKKKQSKQKRSDRKTKDKREDKKFDAELEDSKQNAGSVGIDGRNGPSVNEVLVMHEMPDGLDDVSEVSFNGDDTYERFSPYDEDRRKSSQFRH